MRSVVILIALPGLHGCFSDPPAENLPDTTGEQTSTADLSSSTTMLSSSTSSDDTMSSTSSSTSSSSGVVDESSTSTGESDSSSSESSSSTGDPHAHDHDGVYEYCFPGNEALCSGALVTECVWSNGGIWGTARGFCSESCDTAADCPEVEVGDVACLDYCGSPTCAIHCGPGYTCPEGMFCATPVDLDACGGSWDFICLPED